MDLETKEIIKTLRKEKNLTQCQLAEIMHCDRSKIADIERGKSTPTIEDIKVLSAYFCVSADYLLGISKAATNNKDKQFVCDYVGLSLEAVEDLHNNLFFDFDILNSPVYNINLGEYIGAFRYIDYTDSIRSEFITSNCFNYLIHSAAVCKIIAETVEILGGLSDTDIEKFDGYQLQSFYEFVRKYEREYKYQIFNGQNDFNEFVKGFAPLDCSPETQDKLTTLKQILELKLNPDDDKGDENVND